ncbi:MAG: hypothetical protein Q4D65_00630 [Peptostreptococcaceae bacterium]|nr:hypothetical protein [Peptostreptococcaceae bacterium]
MTGEKGDFPVGEGGKDLSMGEQKRNHRAIRRAKSNNGRRV